MSVLSRAVRLLVRETHPIPERAGLAWTAIYPDQAPSDRLRPAVAPSPVRSVPSSTSPVVIAAENPDRGGLTVVNDSTAILYLKQGPGAAAIAGGYTVALGAGATYVIEPPDPYQGIVTGAWAAVNGSASVTETR